MGGAAADLGLVGRTHTAGHGPRLDGNPWARVENDFRHLANRQQMKNTGIPVPFKPADANRLHAVLNLTAP